MTTATAGCPLHGLGPGGLPLALTTPEPSGPGLMSPERSRIRTGCGICSEPDSGLESAPRDQMLQDLNLGITWRHPQEMDSGQASSSFREVCAGALARKETASWVLLSTCPGFELSWHLSVTMPIVTPGSGTGRALGLQRPCSMFGV